MNIETLLEIEAIRKLRTLYSYYLDAGALTELVDLFAEDAVCEFGPYGTWTGRKTIGENYQKIMAPMIEKGGFQSLHANTNHWIELTGDQSAVGRVYLVDLATGDASANPLIWLGIYDEVYTKVSGKWKVQRSSLQFMWPQRHLTEGFPGTLLPISN